MNMLRIAASLRASRGPAVVGVSILAVSVVLLVWTGRDTTNIVEAADALPFRTVDARLSDGFAYRPLRTTRGGTEELLRIRELAWMFRGRWLSSHSPEAGRRAGAALLLAGEADQALRVLNEALGRATSESEVLAAVRRSDDARLLTDFSAAALERSSARNDGRGLLLAFEAADRAWHLTASPSAGWNRALAAERLGALRLAARSWEQAMAVESSPDWSREGDRKRAAARAQAVAPLEESREIYIHRELIRHVMVTLQRGVGNRQTPREIRPRVETDDPLFVDTDVALAEISTTAQSRRLMRALQSYTRGRSAFENDDLKTALDAFELAEREFDALHMPLVLLARDQRIRCQCSVAHAGCLDNMRAFRAELVASGRYPWMAARAAYGVGQALYRQGRIYEAAEWLQRAATEYEDVRDWAAEGFTHTPLANVFSAAGETDLALSHHLAALRQRGQTAGDRRRRQLEDAVLFMLRYGYLATAELLLMEMEGTPATQAGHVMEATLRGTLAARRGDLRGADFQFQRAHALLASVEDPTARADVQQPLAIAEAAAQPKQSGSIAELDAAIARHQDSAYSVWMPLLLLERGSAYERKGEPLLAENDFMQAIGILERREPRIDQTMTGLGIASERGSPFDRAIRMFLKQGRGVDALSIAQRSAGLRISSLYARSAGLRDSFHEAREPGAIATIADIRAVLPSHGAAIAYHLLSDELITWIITGKDVRIVRRRVRATDLVALGEGLRQCAARPGCHDDSAIERVSGILLRDWIERIPREATLLIQPPAELQGVPFSMLQTIGHESLLVRNPLSTAPTLRAFVRAKRLDDERSGEVSGFFAAAPRPGAGRDPLPLALSEVTRASRLYAVAMVDTHVTRERFLARAPSFSIVHFAGHVVVNDEQPLLSALLFDESEEGARAVLYVHELRASSFARARLVVLSGCETGRSPRPMMSVANALLSQSVPSVVYTLWPVSDEAAETFAVAFHQGLAAGRTRAEAVREAQITLFRKAPGEPEAWAPFALAGVPGPLLNGTKRNGT